MVKVGFFVLIRLFEWSQAGAIWLYRCHSRLVSIQSNDGAEDQSRITKFTSFLGTTISFTTVPPDNST